MIGFVIRLVGYALLLGIAARIAQVLWTNNGLDTIAALQPLHDNGLTALLVAPIVLALVGFGRLRSPAVFMGCFLAGAAITAPLVLVRVVGA